MASLRVRNIAAARRQATPYGIASSLDADPQASRRPGRLLTPRESQVLREVASGRRNREIGTTLGVSVRTVEVHVERILLKLNVKTRTQAALMAVQSGLIEGLREWHQ